MVYRPLSKEEYEDIENRILYEDNHILVINKRIGEIIQGDKTGDEPLSETLKAFIAQRDSKPGQVFIGVPHRLDRPVSGAALFAKTSKCLERMNECFRNGSVHKIYWALTCSKPDPEQADLKHYLVRNEKQNKTYAYDEYARPIKNGNTGVVEKVKNDKFKFPAGAREAHLRYRLLRSFDRYFLIEIELFTGRHHQIRCQLSAIGSPIKGDLKYGSPRSNKDGGISLHARELKFIHPTRKEEVKVIAPVNWSPFIAE